MIIKNYIVYNIERRIIAVGRRCDARFGGVVVRVCGEESLGELQDGHTERQTILHMHRRQARKVPAYTHKQTGEDHMPSR